MFREEPEADTPESDPVRASAERRAAILFRFERDRASWRASTTVEQVEDFAPQVAPRIRRIVGDRTRA